jgi:outer membrane protein assembly factor BamB
MSRLLPLLVLLVSAAQSFAAEIPDRYWPRWRGPSDAGSAALADCPVKWSQDEGLLWKARLPGIGCSTPIVWGDHILLTSTLDGKDLALAFDWTGKPLWQTEIGSGIPGKHRNGSGSNPSIVTDGERIFAYFKSGNLAGLDFNGNVLWKKNLQDTYGKVKLYWDFGTSPALTKRDVIVAVMHGGNSYVAAFDQRTGEPTWKTARNYKVPVECDHSYATPVVIDQNGKEAILIWGAEHLTAHDAENGRELWSCAGFNPEEKRNWVQVASFVIDGDIAVIPYGRGARLAGIRLGGSGDVTDSHRLWTKENIGTFVPSPSLQDGKVFIVRDGGDVVCVNSKTGEQLWQDRFPKHRAKFYASPTVAGDRLYVPREDGVVLVADISNGFKLLAENEMGERLIASPVPIGNRLLIRGEEHLYCIGKASAARK